MTIRAAGAVLWRDGADGVEVAVVHRPRYQDWSLPKGKARAGEPLVVAARREVVEETGHDAALGAWLGRAAYRAGDDEKRVDYWAARCGPAGPRDGDEVDELRWVAVEGARGLVAWDSDREVLARFAAARVPTTTVLLVRHARAGLPSEWAGPDAERPLDATGRAQVAGLAEALPSFWLRTETPYVASAPVVRCVDTVAWAGEIAWDDRLGEHAFAADPARSVACVRELAGKGVAVACSQGGVVPAIVETLRHEDGLGAAAVRAPKGSVWVLSFAEGRLVAADFLSVP